MTEKNRRVPAELGYRMPGEFEPHAGCLMIWPERPGSWNYGGKKAQEAFVRVAEAIADSETLVMLVSKAQRARAEQMLSERIQILEMETDDAWARDVGPTMVVNRDGGVRGINWRFNAWGGTWDGLYADWEKDDQVAGHVCRALGYEYFDASPFVLEGGSIHSDGDGTVIVTEACLLSPGRNPEMTKEEIEQKLKDWLGAEKVIWLKYGIWQDETNEHVDNVCAFVRPGEVVLAWTDDESDPQYPLSLADYELLSGETDAKGRPFVIHKLPIPDVPVRLTQEDVDGFVFEAGEDTREAGERMAASYVNFYISNGGVIVPQFGDVQDAHAVQILGECFPDRKIYPVPARDIIVGGGNIHCITQQIPKGNEVRSWEQGRAQRRNQI